MALKKEDLSGAQFGHWRVESDWKWENSRRKWLCTCQCGTKRYVFEANLLSGKTKSCGCYAYKVKELQNKRFGKLIAVKQVKRDEKGRVCWACQCDCGESCIATRQALMSGKKKSCGCLKKETARHMELKGKKFGRLTVEYATEMRSYKGSVLWHCRCECGKTIDVSADALLSRNYLSCGCKRQEWQSTIYRTLHRVADTCVESLARSVRRDNTSGCTGVYRLKNGKFRAIIGFQKKQVNLGTYKTLEEAQEVRKEAEVHYHQAFLQEYAQWKTQADADPDWSKENPFCFQVRWEPASLKVK